MNKYIVIIHFLIIFNIFINSKPLQNINNKKSNKKAHNKEYYNNLVKKGLELDKIEIGKPYPSIKKINYKKDKIIRKEYEESFKKKKNRRRLSSNVQTLEELGFVDLYQNNSYSDELYALKFLMSSIKKEESKFILYPYPFNYKDKNNEIKNVENGGFFSLNENLLNSGKFNYLQNISSVQIGKAKGIYDIDIAILSEIFKFHDNDVDLFTESGHYCDYFVTQLYKLTSCLRGKEEYLKYKSNYPNKGAVAEISINDLLNNTLYDEEEQLKFRLLIISDYLIGNEETIIDRFTDDCVEILKKFRELGGHIIVSGKSGYLLELLGIFPSGTYNTTITFHSKYKDYTNKIYGCENIYKNSPDEQPDFFKQLICMGFKNRTYLSQGYIMKKIPENFESYINYTNEEKTIYYKTNDGHILPTDKDASVKYHYLLVSKEEKTENGKLKGRIMLINGNPIKDMYYLGNVRNMILYAMSKNLIYDLKIKFNLFNSDEELPIPAGEEGVRLLASYKLYNLGDYDISNIDIDILTAYKVELIPNGGNCVIENDNKYKDLNISYLDKTKYLKCHLDNLEQLNSYSNSFNIEIKDFTVTQKMYDIPLIYSNIAYTDNELQREVISSPGIYFVQAQVAALLRGTINKDPTSIYPIEGYGRYFDLVLDIENKEITEAKEVNFISLIPLVTPLFDGEDEGSVSKVIPLYEEYYENHNYSYPWTNIYNKEDDYIDYVEVAGKNICYVADYDTPVKIAKKNRYELNDTVKNLFAPKGKMEPDDYAGFDSTNANSLLKQIYFGDNEKFYETAKARTSLFINTATEEGAKALYGNNIPEDLKDPYNEKRTKVQYAFIRVDTYFYNSIHDQYQLPEGFNNSILISIDEFDQSSLGEPKGEVLGDRKPTIVNKGHYNSNEKKYNRLKPNEYSNSLREYKFMKQYNPTIPEQLKELQNLTNSTIKLSHFMIPFTDKIEITHAGSIYGFKENEGGKGDGYLEQYPSIKFIYGHSIELILDPAKTRLGGKVEFILENNIKFNDEDPVANEKITVSADNVAFYKTEYKDNKIILYFKRGLMPNENYGQPSKCKVFLEDINKTEDFNIKANLFNFKYDFSKETLELFILEEEKTLKAEYKPFFSLPCLYMENKLSRKDLSTNETSDKMYEYEVMNPYARYGGYYQELTKHTSVYASAEAHHVKNPGFQSASSGFSLLANIGTSSVPFAEFLQHGKLAIPGVVSTSRIEWIDIWGRKWAQNLRSVYPDIPVLPPVPLSFIMTTTYELISDDEKQERLLEWPSDESAYIRVQMKIRNTYKLYWEPTICKNNQITFFKEKYQDYRNPIFDNFENENIVGDDNDINLGFTSQYGMCYDTNSFIGGERITNEILNGIKEMKICSDSEDAVKMSECSKKADELELPLLKKRPDNIKDENDNTPNKNWNYSPLIKSYYPNGYIHSNQMWQLTMEEDYSDDSFYKGYPYHLDDCIPNLDNPINKPHDLIAFPIFKGLGYNISYSNEYSLNRFKDYKGWWSDQLQNKDHTLLAGQENVNQISVGKESLLKDSDWINASNLKNSKKSDLIKNRLKNIYVCQYNQNRVKINPNQNKYAFLKNVYQNNVVPVLPDLSENDERYTKFDCSNENSYQYTPYNISKVDNRVYTGNDRDWLYFAVGLRSNAKENINVILKLDPIKGSKFEGVTKIQDGGRFTYWQPPDGPNSYQYYDSNVNTIISKRVDLSIVHRIIPNSVYAFNTQVYHLFTIEDRKENNREYTMNSYMNSHGYGDATTTVYVGGTDSTSCKVNPGNFTYVKIVFYNNAGFDWKMKEDAITMNLEGYSLPLNAASIMLGKVTAIQYPKKYNFMDYIIPDEIKPYVTMTPSQHNLDISPQFYDLTFNNVLNIKDALEGDYFYCLNVSNSFPEKYKGKLWEIKMKLNEDYFESLPSVNDPTNIHDYHLTIPSIKFGVPLSNGPHAGKVFYNLGQASNITINYKVISQLMFKSGNKVRIVDEKDIHDLTVAISNNDNKYDKLEEIWNSLNKKNTDILKKIKFSSSKKASDSYQNITIDLSKALPLFPYESEQNPFVTNFSILVQSYSMKIPFGYFDILKDTKITYNDGRKTKTVYADEPLNINCFSSGPKIVGRLEDDTSAADLLNTQFQSEDQTIYKGDKGSTYLKFYIENQGTDTSYYNSFDVHLNTIAQIAPSQNEFFEMRDLGNINGGKDVRIIYRGRLDAGDYLAFDIELSYSIGDKYEPKWPVFGDRRFLEETKKGEEKELKILYGLDISFCLDNFKCNEGDNLYVKDKIDLDYSISYIDEQRTVGRIFLKGENIGTDIMPKYVLTATKGDFNPIYNVSTVKYSFKRKIEGQDKDFVEIAFTENNTIIDEPFKEGEIEEKKQYKVSYMVIGFFKSGRTFDSLSQNRITYSYGIENEEPKKENISIYLIVICILVGLSAILLGGFLIYKFGCKKKRYTTEESDGGSSSIPHKKQFEKANTKDKSTSRSINNNIKIINYVDNK